MTNSDRNSHSHGIGSAAKPHLILNQRQRPALQLVSEMRALLEIGVQTMGGRDQWFASEGERSPHTAQAGAAGNSHSQRQSSAQPPACRGRRPKRSLSVDQVARRLGVSNNSVYRYAHLVGGYRRHGDSGKPRTRGSPLTDYRPPAATG